MQAWIRLRHMESSITLCSTPAHTLIRRCLKLFTSCTFMSDSLLNYAPGFVLNWTEVLAVRYPQIWLNDCTTVGFTQLLRMKSLLHTPQTKIAVYDTHYGVLGESVFLDIWDVEWLVCGRGGFATECQLLHRSHTFFSVCALRVCHCRSFGRCFMFLATYSLIYPVLPLSSPVLSGYSASSLHEIYSLKMCSIYLLKNVNISVFTR